MSLNNLHDVLVDAIKDLYHAEKQLVKALPKMAKAATSEELQNAFEGHLEETKGHVQRLESVFKELDMPPKAKPCHAMIGLVEECSEVLEEQDDNNGAAIDAALIMAAQKVEHYEIASYNSVVSFAETLGLDKVASLLQETLDEEEQADEKLSDLAESSINQAAADQDGDEEKEEEDDDEEVEAPVASGARGGRRR